jgi:hypothetical protein
VLKWTFMVGALTTLATACVVSAGDGSGDITGDGGEAGTSSTAGTNSTAGTSSTAGKGGTGGSAGSGTSGSATAMAGADAGGAGGEVYVPGVCDDDLAVPSMPRDTTLNADDETPAYACRKCLKTNCATAWSTCYGEAPTAACGYGSTEDAPGQFECIRTCFLDDMSADDTETILSNCESQCLDQCADKDQGFATADTQELLGCGQESCLVECFTP